MGRRSFLSAALGARTFSRLAAAHKGKVKLTGVKCMIVRGTWDWNLIKIETDAGISGIGEAPLNVDKLYNKMLMLTAGAQSGVTVTAASGIEIALWDLAGRILETPLGPLADDAFSSPDFRRVLAGL